MSARHAVRRASLLMVAGLLPTVGVSGAPVGALEIPKVVSTEAEYRSALTTPCFVGDDLVIDLSADITLASSADPTFAGPCDLTINGNGHTLDGNNNSRSVVNRTDATSPVTLNELVAVNGRTPDDGDFTTWQGGAVRSEGIVVALTSEFRNNTSLDDGGAIEAVGGAFVIDSSFSGNLAIGGVTFAGGGALAATGDASLVINSTFVDNTADDAGGALELSGAAGVFVGNVTFASNAAPVGASARLTGPITELLAVSFSDPKGGGTHCGAVVTTSTFSHAHSAVGDTSCGLVGVGDSQGAAASDPLLGSLGFNGGATRSVLPAAASPLVDVIPLGSCPGALLANDQRGVVRPQGSGCDVGAVERFTGNKPVVTVMVSGAKNARGVYTSDVSVSWDVSGFVWGAPGVDPCPDVTVTMDNWPDGEDFSCSATNEAGTTTETVNVIRDTRPPFYVLVDATGFVYAFPEEFNFGRATVTPFSAAIDIDINPEATGYYILDSAGVVHPVGDDVVSQGNFPTALLRPGERVVALSLTESGDGYWIFTSGGQAVPFGDAPNIGDVANLPLQGAIVDGTPFPPGFYMAGSDGGLFTPPGTNGAVPFFGSVPGQLPGVPLNEPIVTIYTDTDGKGYSLAAGDGGMFNFESVFCGSIPGVLPGVTLNQPVVNAVPFGECYIFFAADGGAFVFGDLPFLGSVPGRGLTIDNITSGDAFGT